MLEIPGVEIPHEFRLSVLEKIVLGETNDVYRCTGQFAGRSSEAYVKVASHPKHCLENERSVLQALATRAIPVPQVLWYGEEGRAALVLQSMAGDTVLDCIDPRRRRYEPIQAETCLRAYGECLGRIHAAPLAWASQRRLRLEDLIGEEDVPETSFKELVSWLQKHVPPTRDRIFVHGDFNTSNVLLQQGQVSGVLDWEFAGAGWREYELAWTLRARTAFLNTQAEREAVLNGYLEHTRYDPDTLRWCEVLNYLHFAYWNRSSDPEYVAFSTQKARELAGIA